MLETLPAGTVSAGGQAPRPADRRHQHPARLFAVLQTPQELSEAKPSLLEPEPWARGTRGGTLRLEMASVLICSLDDPTPTLGGTVLWRQDFERHVARSDEEARQLVLSARPILVLLQKDLPWAEGLVKWLRQEVGSRRISVAVVASGDFASAELGLLEAGANAILRLPPDADWDRRLARLLQVAVRREARVPIHLQLSASLGAAEEPFTASTINVSETGMLVQSAVPLGLGRELDFALQLPGNGGLISGRGRVLRIAGTCEYGVEFTLLEGPVLDRLRAFLKGFTPNA